MSDDDLYFIGDLEDGPIKIGRSSNPHARLKALQTGSPTRLALLCHAAGQGHLESRFHQELAEYRVHGEWFQGREVERAAYVMGDLFCKDGRMTLTEMVAYTIFLTIREKPFASMPDPLPAEECVSE